MRVKNLVILRIKGDKEMPHPKKAGRLKVCNNAEDRTRGRARFNSTNSTIIGVKVMASLTIEEKKMIRNDDISKKGRYKRHLNYKKFIESFRQRPEPMFGR